MGDKAIGAARDRLRALAQPTGEEELLAVRYPRPRLHIPLPQAIAVAVAMSIALGAWGWWGARDDAAGDSHPAAITVLGSTDQALPPPVAAPGEVAPGADGPGIANTGAPELTSATAEVVVAVVGEVHRPGVYTLAPNSRVADALDMAQPTKKADTLSLNLAQKLNDGEQIRVYARGEAPAPPPRPPNGSAASSGGTDGKVNLNSATREELMALPGVGEVTADAIVAYREEKGGFSAVDELLDISGIGPAKFKKLEGEVIV